MTVNDPRPELAAKPGREPPEAPAKARHAERLSPNPSRQAGGERNGTPPNTLEYRAWRERQRQREEREKQEAAARLHDIA